VIINDPDYAQYKLNKMSTDKQVRIKRQMTQGHLSTADVGEIAAGAGVKTVILTHLTAKPDDDLPGFPGRKM
jgi:ribonuclease BN (tRNA processing enzyme)